MIPLSPEASLWTVPPQCPYKRTFLLSQAQGTLRCEETSKLLPRSSSKIPGDLGAPGGESQEDGALSQPSAESIARSSPFFSQRLRYVNHGTCHTQCPFLAGTAPPRASAQYVLCREAAPD